jgi:hypothetical protein
MLKPMALVALILVLGVLGYGLWYHERHPREIIDTSSVLVESRKAGGERQTLTVRTVRIANTTFQEIQLPSGTWLDCGTDCRQAARDAGDDFWVAQEKTRK